jgi:hypothetical protein
MGWNDLYVDEDYYGTMQTSKKFDREDSDVFPFVIIPLVQAQNWANIKVIKKIWHQKRCTNYGLFKKCGGGPLRESYLIKITPPSGWLVLGDAIIQAPSGNNPNNFKGIKNIKIAFVKNNPLYAIPCDKQYQLIDIASQTEGSKGGANCDLENTSETGKGTANVMKLDTSNTNYIAPGTRFKLNDLLNDISDLRNYAAINRNWIEVASYKLGRKSTDYWWNEGSLAANGGSDAGGCEFNAYLSVAYYDRTNSKNGNLIDETQDNTVTEGKLTFIGNSFSSTPPNWDWRDGDSAEGPSQIIYVIHLMNTNRLCCLGNGNFGPAECGLGLNKIQKGSSQCIDQFRKDCTFSSPFFPTNYCIKNACRNNVKSDNPIVCDYELKNFCNNPSPKYTKEQVQNYIAELNSIKNTRLKQNFIAQMNDTEEIKLLKKKPGYDVQAQIEYFYNLCVQGTQLTDRYGGIPCRELKNALKNDDVRTTNAKNLLNSLDQPFSQYLKYPDMCSCFMSTKTLKGECDSMASNMKLTNNKPAKKVLNIDTEDPLQCTQNCLFHPLCKTAVSVVPSSSTYPTNRQGKYVQHGFMQDKANCGNRDICIQKATVNTQGKIGSLEINQTANCGSYKSKMCQNSELSKCIYQSSSGEFVKQVITEKDGGNCGSSIESLSCASIDLSPLYDSGCKNGKRTLIYKQKKNKVNSQDVIDALNTILPSEFKKFNPVINYEPVTNQAFIVMDCQDCVLDYELTGQCYLEGNRWKVKGKKTKTIKKPFNGGSACKLDTTEKIVDCDGDTNCSVSVKTQDSGCVKGKDGKVRNIVFNIDSYNSGNGKNCDDVITQLLPPLYKDNIVSITYSDDGKTATASIDCRDCVIDYKIDQSSNGGECYLNDTGKMVIKKIPYLKRQPLNGGECDEKILKSIKDKTPIIQSCTFNQDCEFNSEPVSDKCNLGERVLEFDIKTPSNGSGKSCQITSKIFGVKYTDDTTKNTFINDKLYIKTKCEKTEDCVLEDTPSQSACDIITGKGVDIYKVLTKPKIGGKTCTEVATKKNKGIISIKEGTNTISITKKCSNPIDKKKLLYMAIALAVIILLIIVILLVV